MRSPYTLDDPPPDEPPNGVLVPSLWRVQARWWKRHTPALDQRSAKQPICGHCRQAWPCHSWACWDGQLGEAIAAPGLAADPLSEAAAAITRLSPPTGSRSRALKRAMSNRSEKSAA